MEQPGASEDDESEHLEIMRSFRNAYSLRLYHDVLSYIPDELKKKLVKRDNLSYYQFKCLDCNCCAMLCKARNLRWTPSEDICGHVRKEPENSGRTDFGTDSSVCEIVGAERVTSSS